MVLPLQVLKMSLSEIGNGIKHFHNLSTVRIGISTGTCQFYLQDATIGDMPTTDEVIE